MERWAANTLRSLGIVFTAIIVICGCLYLVLLGLCAAAEGHGGPRDPAAGAGYYLGAVLLGLAGILFIAVLARGIFRSRQTGAPVAQSSESIPPPDSSSVSSEGRRAVDRLFWGLAAKLALTGLECVYSLFQYQRLLPQTRLYYSPLFLVSSLIYAIPFAALMVLLRRRVTRTVLAFSFGIPAAAILEVLIAVLPLMRVYLNNSFNLGSVVLALIVDIVLVVLAYQSAKSTGFQPPTSSLFTATAIGFVYFYVLHLVTPFFYRLVARH